MELIALTEEMVARVLKGSRLRRLEEKHRSRKEWEIVTSGEVRFRVGDVWVLIDEEDFHKIVAPYPWCLRAGYVTRCNSERRCLFLHREIIGCPEGLVVDHINHDPLDNRRVNLRCVTHTENLRNRKPKVK
jgi:hypothetical protein